MNITKKDITSSLGLILMFTLGWIANDLITQMNDNKTEREQMRQRMNRLEYIREEQIQRDDRDRQRRWDMQQYDQEKQRWNRKKDKTEQV
jgi:Flp pilus assembly protein TadB|tara:strand:+ start:608 stop:877 length:270 start_codon:yes stop_codon:yes gene_type:complete